MRGPSQQPIDHLVAARRYFQLHFLDEAAESAYNALLQDPQSFDATLIAAEIEAARGNHQAAADLAGSVDVQWRLAEKAVELHARQLVELGRPSDAADVLLRALQVVPNSPRWRHQAWEFLSRVGRREEASRQAEILCRGGQATERELISLVRRTESFPAKLENVEELSEYFEPGLGMARWYFTQLEFRKALDELSSEYESGFRTAAASALYGRLLAETQAFEEVSPWHAKCNLAEVKELGDYWAALGTYFFDQRQFEASARALLEAIKRNPTDRVSVQRLARALDALGRADDAEQFRHRGADLGKSERFADEIESSASAEARRNLTRLVMELGRPFETLAWSVLGLPADAIAQRKSVQQQRERLLRSGEALEMASEIALLEIDPVEFSLEPAYEELLRSGGSRLPKPGSVEVEQLAQPRLVNVAGEVGLDFQWYRDEELNLKSIPIHESFGGGIGVIDYDLDGWPDIYLAQGSGEPPTDRCTRSNQLMRNIGARFTEVTKVAGANDYNYGSGLAVGDVNQDGFADLFLGSLGRNRLLINNGDGTFRDATDSLGEVADRFTTSLAIADINGDSLPDLFEGIYIEMEGAFDPPEVGKDGLEVLPSPLKHYAQSDRWYQNIGDGGFQLHEITREVAKPGSTLGLIVADFDGDRRNEVFVGNDARSNHFLVQSGDNQFVNAADAKGIANGFDGLAYACMGIASGDFNRDGILDLHITNFKKESANLYLQTASGGFTDLAIRYGLDEHSLPMVGFGTKAIDIDRNGWLDLVVTNGHVFDRRRYGEEFLMPPQLFINTGSRFKLVAVDDDSGYWEKIYLGRTMAMLDFDRDRAMDILINHLDQPLALLHNQTKTEGKALQFQLVGTSSERDAIGARVVVNSGQQQQTQWVTAGDGYYCSDEAVVDFGLGTSSEAAEVQVFWPSGQRQTFGPVHSGRRYLVVEGESELYVQ